MWDGTQRRWLGSATLAVGCAFGAGEEQGRVDPVVGGVTTYAHPEIGKLSVGCTATLIAPQVGITAAHCFGYRSVTTPGAYGTFTLEHDDGRNYRYTIERYVSFSRQLGRDDIALFRLTTAVPAAVATPASLASEPPANNALLTVYGYGCTARGASSDWRKRRRSFRLGENVGALCPGDSGGPVLTETGAILLINSGYYYSGADIFGQVPPNYPRLTAQVAAWTASPSPAPAPSPTPDPVPSPTPDPCASRASTCGACTPIAGCGWCGATNTCVAVDAGGNPLRGCASGFALNPPDCPGSGGDRCGAYAAFPEFTCRRGATGFARCRPGGEPEFLQCPSGTYCPPGSRTLWCYRW